MKRMFQRTLALGVLLLVVGGTAQAQGGTSFHLAGGPVLPQGSFNDAFKTGWQGMAGANFHLPGIPFLVRIDVFYGQHVGDQSVVGNDVKQKLLGGLVGAHYNLAGAASSVRPYVVGLVGLTNAKLQVGTLDDSETKLTFAGGLGVAFKVSSLSLFLEGKYMQVQTSTESVKMIPLLLGVQFGGGM